jgi:hypothetical protein
MEVMMRKYLMMIVLTILLVGAALGQTFPKNDSVKNISVRVILDGAFYSGITGASVTMNKGTLTYKVESKNWNRNFTFTADMAVFTDTKVAHYVAGDIDKEWYSAAYRIDDDGNRYLVITAWYGPSLVCVEFGEW